MKLIGQQSAAATPKGGRSPNKENNSALFHFTARNLSGPFHDIFSAKRLQFGV
ncbi:MAG TPA: hypothetical protein VFY83_02425 [Anaerolineales bacterium]|nr:hypothetical protein [Anaerolineales bacterium]